LQRPDLRACLGIKAPNLIAGTDDDAAADKRRRHLIDVVLRRRARRLGKPRVTEIGVDRVELAPGDEEDCMIAIGDGTGCEGGDVEWSPCRCAADGTHGRDQRVAARVLLHDHDEIVDCRERQERTDCRLRPGWRGKRCSIGEPKRRNSGIAVLIGGGKKHRAVAADHRQDAGVRGIGALHFVRKTIRVGYFRAGKEIERVDRIVRAADQSIARHQERLVALLDAIGPGERPRRVWTLK